MLWEIESRRGILPRLGVSATGGSVAETTSISATLSDWYFTGGLFYVDRRICEAAVSYSARRDSGVEGADFLVVDHRDRTRDDLRVFGSGASECVCERGYSVSFVRTSFVICFGAEQYCPGGPIFARGRAAVREPCGLGALARDEASAARG